MKEVLARLGSIFLVGFLLAKLSAFHIYEHHDTLDESNTHCELCVLTMEVQQFDGILPASLAIDYASIVVPFQTNIISFDQKIISTPEEGTHFSRPPPYTLI